MPKLILLAGKQKREGWVTLDANEKVKPDHLASIPPLPDEVKAVAWEAIELIHGIEHFYLWQARELLKEIHAALMPGGKLILELPNLAYAIQVLAGLKEADPIRHGMWPLYGDPGHRTELFCHRWGYTPETLQQELRAAGFRGTIKREQARSHVPVRDFRMVAVKGGEA